MFYILKLLMQNLRYIFFLGIPVPLQIFSVGKPYKKIYSFDKKKNSQNVYDTYSSSKFEDHQANLRINVILHFNKEILYCNVM